MPLNIDSNLSNPDAFYERLIDLHGCLSDEQSLRLNETLAEMLSERVADSSHLQEASAIAGDTAAGETAEYTAKLILLLSNHLGDAVVEQALSEAQTVAAQYRAAA